MRYVFAVFLFSSFIAVSHDIQVAYYEISESEEGFVMSIKFDRDDLLRELGSYSDVRQAVNTYLEGHLSILFNGEKVGWEVEKVELSDLFILISCNILTDQIRINTVNIWITSLLDLIEKHNNLLTLKINGRYRSFRLDSTRRQTVIKY